jgi:hypothetical protein
MDPEYYSPYEVSYRFHGAFSFAANRARDTFFLQRQISGVLPAHSRTTGFVYGVLDAGVKYAHILILEMAALKHSISPCRFPDLHLSAPAFAPTASIPGRKSRILTSKR